MATYAEISPSQTGVKLIGRGRNPLGTGKNKKLDDQPTIAGKRPGVELYDRGRYFAITGWRLEGTPAEVQVIPDDVLSDFCDHFFPSRKPAAANKGCNATLSGSIDRQHIIERCRRYVSKMPPAISGSRGHDAAFNVCCELFRFGLTDSEARQVFDEFNSRCEPPWSDREIEHKLSDARDRVISDGEFGTRLREERATNNRDNGRDQVNTKSSSPGPGDTEAVERPRFANMLSWDEFMALDLRPTFIIKGVLVEGQPCVIGGLSKTLKTTIAVDLAVSIGSGTPFLGKFPTTQKRVGVWSGESGAATLKDAARRIAEARGITAANVDWSHDLPKLSRIDHLQWLEQVIEERGIEVAIIDPLYLSLLSAANAGQAGNVFAMGSALEPLTAIGQRTGCTIIALHHFKRSAAMDTGEPASLEMLSQAGIVEWCRQWILLARRSAYSSDGLHELWLRCGGSAGHASFWALDVDEGVIDPETLEGRHWHVQVSAPHEARETQRQNAEAKKADQLRDRDDQDRRRMLSALRQFPEGQSKSILRDLAGLNADRAGKALTDLMTEGRAELCNVTKNKRTETGYRATGK